MWACATRFKTSFGLLGLVGLSLFFAGCAAPRTGTLSPAALPKGDLALGGQSTLNLPTQTSSALYGGLEDGIQRLIDESSDQDTTAIKAQDLNAYVRALFAYSLDPLGSGMDFYARYGLFDRLDAGYAYASGAHAFQVRYQFTGPILAPTRNDKKPAPTSSDAWQGSAALQYSWQDYDLPSFLYLDKLQSLLRYEFSRRDILIPVVFGKSLGANGRYGSLGMGAAFHYAWIEYGSDIFDWVEELDDGSTRPFEKVQGHLQYPSYGLFSNARLGYKHVFVVLSFAAFYQQYGEIELFGGEKTELSGMTFTPSLGLEVQF
jgi:hypothetical protein